ncbi:MAG: CpsD/CapB family tyrosine-protein kinase, partial [Cyanobacteria bacterium P01_E01_bin.6]
HESHLVHTITSATPQEGKTITSLNLGLSFAEIRARKTVVIEADLRLPTFEKLMPLGGQPGLINYLRGEAAPDEIIRTIGEDGLNIIPAVGRASNEAVQLLSGPRMTQLLETLRARFDHVIIDTPPVLELADAGILGAVSNDVLLIARMNRTPQTLIEQGQVVSVRVIG